MTLLASILLGASFVSVQVGSFTEERGAVRVVEDLQEAGHDAYFLGYPSPEQGAWTYKVRVGRFRNNAEARPLAARLGKEGYPGAFPETTDLVETQDLSSSLTTLVGALGSVNPGRIKLSGTGKRLHVYTRNYLTLFLLAAKGDPGRRLTDLAVWDTNPDNHPELFAVIDGKRAYALFWVPAESRYALAELHEGEKVSVGEVFDLTAGPEKFIAIRYEQGGDLYREAGYLVFRWDHPEATYTRVGRIPLEVADRGEEPGEGISRRRTAEAAKIDGDADRELLVRDFVDSGDSTKEHIDVWDWDGTRLERVTRMEWFEEILAADPGNETAAGGLFGLGIERGLDGELDEAQKVFQRLVSNHPRFEVSKRAKHAIRQIGERRDKARVLNQTGQDEILAGAPELAERDLKVAVRMDPGNASAHYNLAAARVGTGDTLGALRALKRAIELDPDDTKIRERARTDEKLKPLRQIPEFKEILRL